jgi:hypothetical protein
MDFTDLEDAIAAVAHRCWCKRMLQDGWRPGKLFDEEAREHDALRPYHQLSTFRRAQLRQHLGWDELEPALAGSAHNAHTIPQFSAHDIYKGMRVRFIDDPSGDIGKIVEWETSDEEAGMVESISVEWPSGEVVEYASNEQAIEPVEEP